MLNFDFVPLTEAKATLSEQVRNSKNRRIALTNHGKPEAVLLSYNDFLELLKKVSSNPSETNEKLIPFEKWDRERKNRREVSRSIASYFDMEKLKRKGQKKYKKKRVTNYP